MLVLCSIVDVQVVKQMTTQTALRQHALHGVLDDALRSVGVLAQLGRRVETLATGIARVAGVELLSLLLAGEDHLVGVDDNHVVATVNMRSECGLVLSAKQFGNL